MKRTFNCFNRVLFALLLYVGVIIISCEEIQPISVTSVNLNSTSMELVEGTTQTLIATVSPSNADNQKVIWSSSNSSVATVTDGVVTAIKTGTAIITVKTDDGGKTATCEVIIKPKTLASIKVDSVGATTASLIGSLTTPSSDWPLAQVKIFYSDEDIFNLSSSQSVSMTEFDENGQFIIQLSNLKYNAKYQYCVYTKVKSEETYSDVCDFKTDNIVVSINQKSSIIGSTTAQIKGEILGLSSEDKSSLSFGVLYSPEKDSIEDFMGNKQAIIDIRDDGVFICEISGLSFPVRYHFRHYIKQNNNYEYGEVYSFDTVDKYLTMSDIDISSAIDLSKDSSANCYIISESGTYKFKPVKGNSNMPVGEVVSCSILWESFGTKKIPERCELVQEFTYKDGYIAFKIPDEFKEGNAVIAAKDLSGKILWSWHIWLTDYPAEQIYYNNAGVLMDRNLGATSATPGDVCALGLIYQWGRKDPFLGSDSNEYSIYSHAKNAKSTITWPPFVESSPEIGTIEYTITNPMTYLFSYIIKGDDGINFCNEDWYYVGRSILTDNTRWGVNKTIYDPCPIGWRVPEGGTDGVWAAALNTQSRITPTVDQTNKGINFYGLLGDDNVIWYPFVGEQGSGSSAGDEKGLSGVGHLGTLWSISSSETAKNFVDIFSFGSTAGSTISAKAYGRSVRCVKEE